MSIFKKFIASQKSTELGAQNTHSHANKIQEAPTHSNLNQKEDIPHYLKKAMNDFENATSLCKKSFLIFQKELEELIKRANMSGADKEFIKKSINHGSHSNYYLIDLNEISKITAKYLYPLDMNFKGKFRSAESNFTQVKMKYDTSKGILEKIKNKYK